VVHLGLLEELQQADVLHACILLPLCDNIVEDLVVCSLEKGE
jgi:hypothetical protein